jgi:hypothetical protein
MGTVPGVWLVMSGWTPEYVPDRAGKPVGVPECLAIALALVPSGPERGAQPRVRLRPTSRRDPSGEVDLVALAGQLVADGGRQVPAREASDDRARRLRVGTATYRLDPGHVAGAGALAVAGARPVVVARGCGVQIELEPAASSGMRRMG